jgi:hypothetical protein
VTAPDTHVKRYSIDSFEGGPANKQEALYQGYITKGMETGEFADVTSALHRTGRENMLDATRSQMQGEAQGAQAGYQPGTAEYNRAIALSNAGASERTMDRNNAVNALQRGAVKEAMSAGKEIGQTARDRQLDERTHTEGMDAIQYNQNRTAYNDQKGDIEAYINGLSPQAQNKARELMAQGKDPRGAGFTTATGSISEPFRGLTRGQQDQASVLEQAKSRVPQLQNETDEAYNQRLQQEVVKQNMDTYQTAYNPINSTSRANKVAESVNKNLEEKAATGKGLSTADWKSLNATRSDLIDSIPVVESFTTDGNGGYAKNAKEGDIVMVGNQKARVINPTLHVSAGSSWDGLSYKDQFRDGVLVEMPDGTQQRINLSGKKFGS